jgi:hypothetical protein
MNKSKMQAGRVKVAEDSDFKHFIELCNETDEWKQEYNKRNTVVSTKTNDIPVTCRKIIIYFLYIYFSSYFQMI